MRSLGSALDGTTRRPALRSRINKTHGPRGMGRCVLMPTVIGEGAGRWSLARTGLRCASYRLCPVAFGFRKQGGIVIPHSKRGRVCLTAGQVESGASTSHANNGRPPTFVLCEFRIDMECGISIPLSDASLDSRPRLFISSGLQALLLRSAESRFRPAFGIRKRPGIVCTKHNEARFAGGSASRPVRL